MAKEGVSTPKKIGCSIGIALAAILIIFAFCGRFFSSPLRDIANFFVGSFGMAFYGMMIALIVACSFTLAGKTIRIPAKYVAHFCLMFVEIVLLVHLFSTIYITRECADYAQYAKYVYNYYSGVPTFGGIVFGTVAYGLNSVITIYGASVVLFGLLAWSVIMVGDFFYSYFTGKINLSKKRVVAQEPTPVVPEVAQPVVEEIDDERTRALKILFSGDEHSLRTEDVSTTEVYNTAQQSVLDRHMPKTKEEAEDFLFNTSRSTDSFFGADSVDDDADEGKNDEIGVKGYYNAAPQQEPTPQKDDDSSWRISRSGLANDGWITPQDLERKRAQREEVDIVNVVAEEPAPAQQPEAPVYVQQPVPTPTPQPAAPAQPVEQPVRQTVQQQPPVQPKPAPEPVVLQPREEPAVVQTESTLSFEFDDEDDIDIASQLEPQADDDEPFVDFEPQKPARDPKDELIPIKKETVVPGGIQEGFDFRTQDEIRTAQEKIHNYPKYVVPPADLLNDALLIDTDDSEYREMAAQAIVNKLAVFGIKIEAVDQIVGPTVTRYRFRVLSEKTRMGDFKQYSADLKACLEAQDEIRIEAPIEGTNLVGIEVANKTRTPVMLRTMLESKAFKDKKGALIFTIGQEISGEMIVADLAKLPHLLVAGTTGSGKSVFLNTMIVSLMYRYGPEYLRFVMVDPKFVELSRYNGIPHMLTSETITNPSDALGAMDYLIAEMESRYQLFRQNAVANIADYNAKINPKLAQKLPYLVLVVDELADLMSVCQKNFEAKLQRLAQKARAAGIHMVLATQRPDVKTITGTIKTNLPCRIAFKVSAPQDSVTILSAGGAEKLLGNGDMLYMNPTKAGFARAQGAYISDEEIASLVEYVTSQNEVFYDAKISEEIFVSRHVEEQPEPAPQQESSSSEEQLDPYCKKALRFWLERQQGRASIASIQRALKIGFNRAGRIMDSLQKLHYVEELAANDTSTKPVKVLISAEELDELFPGMEDY